MKDVGFLSKIVHTAVKCDIKFVAERLDNIGCLQPLWHCISEHQQQLFTVFLCTMTWVTFDKVLETFTVTHNLQHEIFCDVDVQPSDATETRYFCGSDISCLLMCYVYCLLLFKPTVLLV